MHLGSRKHTVGNVTIYFVDYWRALREGDWIASCAVTSSAPDTTISDVIIQEGHVIQFTLSGGVLNETFTVTVQATDNNSEISNDTIDFNVVGP
jgi:hypothetical protein